jgi:NAD(P)-dependent dehydrogenase (short-subunit alcohol dehydrogenase family)
MNSLAGRTALITGSCGEGMGRSIALRLARDGAGIVLNYGTHRRGPEMETHAKRIAEAVASLGGRAAIHEANTTVEAEVAAMVKAAEAAFGAVDILVNNAGGEWHIQDYTKVPLDHWRSVLAAEIDGAFLLMKHVVPGMRERRWGRVIHLSMERSLHFGSMKGVAADYCLGKAARAWMTNAFGHDELAHGITMNCLEPGIIDHLGFDEALAAARGDTAAWRQRTGPTAHDAAEIVAFLCSEAGRFVSASGIRVLNP